MTTITTKGIADRIAEAFPEEYVAGLDQMDAEDAAALALVPTMGARAETLADPTAEAEYGEVLDRLCEEANYYGSPDAPLAGGPLGHVGHEELPEALFCAALWEAA